MPNTADTKTQTRTGYVSLAARPVCRTFPQQAIRLATLLPLALLLLLFTGTPASAAEQYWEYTVRPGDNIWNLTKQHCTSVRYWQRIQRLNNIDLDRQIPPGTRLRFPLSILKHQPASAHVTRLHGRAELLRASGGQPAPVEVGTELHSGDGVNTAADSNLTLQFADGSQLLVLADSTVVMDSLSAWGTTGMVDTRIRLQGGRVDTRVKPARGPGSRYQIITPAAVAAVRGTAFRVAADAGKALMRSEVTQGTVGVGNAARSTAVPAGFGLVAEAGKPLGEPRELLPAVDLSRLPAVQRQLPLDFDWPALDGAQAYRVQIAPDIRFETLLADWTTSQPAAHWQDLPDGHYALRIRGIDEVGLEGLDSEYRFEVDARPVPPPSASPADTAVIATARPTFSWTATPDSAAYRIQVARDSGFADLVTDQNVASTSFRQVPALTPGTYHWRVAGVDTAGQQGPFNTPRHFTYRPPLAAPATRQPLFDRARLILAWQVVEGAGNYQLQLATDPYFRDLLVNTEVQATRIDLPRPPSQVYFFRVRAINLTGDAGPFSPPQKFYVPPLYPWWPLVLAVPLLLVL